MGSDSCQMSETYTYLYEAICMLNLNLHMINNSSVCHKEQGRSSGNFKKVFLTGPGPKESQSMPSSVAATNAASMLASKHSFWMFWSDLILTQTHDWPGAIATSSGSSFAQNWI